MDTENKYMNDIHSLIEKEKLRCYLNITKITGKANFMLYKGLIDEKEYSEIINDIPITNINYTSLSFNEIIEYRFFLSEYYKKAIKIFNQYKYNYNSKDVLDDEVKKQFLEFLKYMNCYKLYERIKKNGMMTFPKELKNKSGCCIANGKLSYIVFKNDPDKLFFYTGMAHEMGHALASFMFYNNKEYIYSLGKEIPSILFEKIFLDFIMENSNLDTKRIINETIKSEKKYIDITKKTKRTLDILDNPRIDYSFEGYNVNYTYKGKQQNENINRSNRYAIGNIVSYTLLKEYEKDKDFFVKHIEDVINETTLIDAEDFLEKYNDFEPIDLRLSKYLVKK